MGNDMTTSVVAQCEWAFVLNGIIATDNTVNGRSHKKERPFIYENKRNKYNIDP